jgi:hypothetical protein
VAVTASLVLVAALGLVVVRLVANHIVFQEACTATAGGAKARVSVEQAENASIIASVAARRGLPARAATIALATALQESRLRNLDHGDRDSLGLFQQRPSQGWGTAAEVMNPEYAANAFYDALVKIDDYTSMDINDAAQQVQRSGHPEAYNKHETRARALASSLMGYSKAAFTCAIRPDSVPDEEPGAKGLTPRAETALDAVQEAFGPQDTGGYAPGGVSTGHMENSAHYEGRAIDFFYQPVNATQRRDGWATAQWLVANAEHLDVGTVIYDGRIWTAGRSVQGWRAYTPPGGATDNATLMHRDHVHLDVR